MTAHRTMGVASVGLLGGCGRMVSNGPPTADSIGSEILREVAAFSMVLSARWVVYATVVIAAFLLLRRFVALCIRVVWRLGWDTDRAMARGQSALDFTFAVVGTLLVLRPFFEQAPILTSVITGGGGLLIAIALPTWVQDFTAGLELSTRNTIREGDQVELDRNSGTIRSLGVLRTRLRAGDGSTITVPNRLLATATVRVGRDSGAIPVVAKLPTEKAVDPAYREQIERLALLCPYRRSGSVPVLREGPEGWTITLQTWSTRDVAAPQRALEKLVREFEPSRTQDTREAPDAEGEPNHA